MKVLKYKVTALNLGIFDAMSTDIDCVYVHEIECEVENDQIIQIRDTKFNIKSEVNPYITRYIFDTKEEAVEFCTINRLPYVTDTEYNETIQLEDLQRLWIENLYK